MKTAALSRTASKGASAWLVVCLVIAVAVATLPGGPAAALSRTTVERQTALESTPWLPDGSATETLQDATAGAADPTSGTPTASAAIPLPWLRLALPTLVCDGVLQAENSRLGLGRTGAASSLGRGPPKCRNALGKIGRISTNCGGSYDSARYYDAKMAAWQSADPALGQYLGGKPHAGVFVPRNLGLYSYSLNNPIVLRDPNGASWEWFSPGTSEGMTQTSVELAKGVYSAAVDQVAGAIASGPYYATPAYGVGLPTPDMVERASGAATQFSQAAKIEGVNPVAQGVGTVLLAGAEMVGTGALLARPGLGSTAGLAARAEQVHGVLDPIAQAQRTTAVLRTSGGTVVAGGARDLTPAQRALLGPGEIAAKLPGSHAEVTAIQAAKQAGLTPEAMAVTRPICPGCSAAIKASGGSVTSPKTAVWSKPR